MTRSQQFQCSSGLVPRGSVTLPAIFDDSVQRYIVRWENVRRAFPGALYVLKDNEMVDFECDNHLTELEPKRIAASPNAVLEVVVQDQGTETECLAEGCRRSIDSIQPRSPKTFHEIDTTEARDQDNTISRFPIQIPRSDLEVIFVGQDRQTDRIAGLIADQTANISAAINVVKKMQKRTLDHLTIVQAKLQAVLTQNYELFEYPIPRLFIILPSETRLRDKFNPFTMTFRLYFLCECGDHTMNETSKTPHKIHLAKHDGYEIERSTEFLEKYGPYILTVLKLIKYGSVAATVVTSALAMANISEQMDHASEKIKAVKEKFGSLVDDTIDALQYKIDLTTPTNEHDDISDYSHIEALEGADLRQLESYIKKCDSDRALGNLYRIITHEGHVKWVCLDHYRENYKESVRKQLEEVVEANGGNFCENEGKITIRLASKSAAKQFYNILQKAKGINELDLWLDWDASHDDLRKLQAVVKVCNVSILRLNATRFHRPLSDMFNRGRRFDPLIDIMTNGRIRSFELVNCQGFFRRISHLPKSASSASLRTLSFVYFDPIDLDLVSNLIKALPGSGILRLANEEIDVSVGRLESPDAMGDEIRYSLSIKSSNISLPYSLETTRALFSKSLAKLTLQEQHCTISNLDDILICSPELDSITIDLDNHRNVFNMYYLISQRLRGLSHRLQSISMRHVSCRDEVTIECYSGHILKATIQERNTKQGHLNSFSDGTPVSIIISGGSMQLEGFSCLEGESFDESVVYEFWQMYPGVPSMSITCHDLESPESLGLLLQLITRYSDKISRLHLTGGDINLWAPELSREGVNIDAFPNLSDFSFTYRVTIRQSEEDEATIQEVNEETPEEMMEKKSDVDKEEAEKELNEKEDEKKEREEEEDEEEERGEKEEVDSIETGYEMIPGCEERLEEEEGPFLDWLKRMLPAFGSESPRQTKLSVLLENLYLSTSRWAFLLNYIDYLALNDLRLIGGSLANVDLGILEQYTPRDAEVLSSQDSIVVSTPDTK